MKVKRDANYIRPLYIWCNILGILPLYNFQEDISAVSNRFKIFTIFHIMITISIFGYSDYGRKTFLYGDLDMTVVATDKIAHVLLTFLNVAARYLFIFHHGEKVKQFFNSAYCVSKKCDLYLFTHQSFTIQFICVNLYIAFLLIFDSFVWIGSLGLRIFKFYAGRSLLYYISNIIIFLMFQTSIMIQHFLKSVNSSLDTTLKNLICNDVRREYFLAEFRINGLTKTDYTFSDVKKIRILYSQICDLVDKFNAIFGFIILITTLFAVSYMLNLTDLALVYALNKSRNIQGSEYGFDLMILCILWMTTLLVSVLEIILQYTVCT